MKKNKLLKIILLAAFIIPKVMFAQFNTITQVQPKKETFSNVFEKEKENKKLLDAQEKEAKDAKKTNKKRNSKTDVKKELDSLKMLLLQYTLKKSNQNNINYKKIEDTLVNIIQKQTQAIKKDAPQQFFKMDYLNEPENYSLSKIFMPLNKKLNITSSFGTRIHPIFGTKKLHSGVDLAAYYEDVHSVLDGIVVASGWDSGGGGNYIKVQHSGRFETIYMHLSDSYYKAGEKVKAGWIIAKSGNTGNSTGPHLHFSVKEYGNYINPIKFLNDLVKVNNLIALRYEK